MMTGREIVGNFMYPRDAPARLLQLAAADLLDLGSVPTEHHPLVHLPMAMDRAAEKNAPLMTIGGVGVARCPSSGAAPTVASRGGRGGRWGG